MLLKGSPESAKFQNGASVPLRWSCMVTLFGLILDRSSSILKSGLNAPEWSARIPPVLGLGTRMSDAFVDVVFSGP